MSAFSLSIAVSPDQKMPGEKSFSLDYKTADKFKNDKFNLENDDILFVLDGIILNKFEL